MKYTLKPEYRQAIKDNALLYGQIADVLGLSIFSMNYNIYNNNWDKFTQKSVLAVMSKYLNVPEDQLTEIIEPETV
jgi:hypothetical protein